MMEKAEVMMPLRWQSSSAQAQDQSNEKKVTPSATLAPNRILAAGDGLSAIFFSFFVSLHQTSIH